MYGCFEIIYIDTQTSSIAFILYSTLFSFLISWCKDRTKQRNYKIILRNYYNRRKCNLAVLNIPKGVIEIGNFAFAYCRLLTSIFIPESVTSSGSCAFYGCSNLATVVMEDGVTSIESSTFSNCPKLANIILPRYLYSIGENAFSKCSMLENITIPNSVDGQRGMKPHKK